MNIQGCKDKVAKVCQSSKGTFSIFSTPTYEFIAVMFSSVDPVRS